MRRRRGRGEGSVFQRKDGLWSGVLTLGYDANSRRRRRAVYAPTKGEVLAKLAALQAQVLNGYLSEPQRLKVGGFLDRWLTDTARARVRPSTYRLYCGIVQKHITKHIGGVTLARLMPNQVRAMLTEMEKEQASPRLRQIAFGVLRLALKQAARDGSIPRNPCDAIDAPKAPRRIIKSLTRDEATRLLDAARGDRLEALYIMALSCGLREAELFGATWSNVNLKEETIQITQQLTENNGHPALVEPKTKSAIRQIDLPSIALQALRDHRQRTFAQGTLHNSLDLVFTDSEGKPLRRSNFLRREFTPTLKKAGLPRIRFHDLRHSCASLALQGGVPPHVVARMLGHSRVSITLDLYAHVLPGQGKEAAAKMDAIFAAREKL